MHLRLKTALEKWFRAWWHQGKPPRQLTDLQQAAELINAIDAGGLPLNPARVNAIARGLGLEVSVRAPVEETIARIRQALKRAG